MRSSFVSLVACSDLACLGPTLTERILWTIPDTKSEFVPTDWMSWTNPIRVEIDGYTLLWNTHSRELFSPHMAIVVGSRIALPFNINSLVPADIAKAVHAVRPEPRRNSWKPDYFPPERHGRRLSILRSASKHFPKK